MTGRIFVACETAHAKLGEQIIVVAGDRTTAREGHPIVTENPDLWVPLVPTFEVEPEPEQAPAKRPAAPKAAAPKAAAPK